jgi:NDP-sugar pyrophosphorylase family protein
MIIAKTPFRLSFFGGGTDFPEFFLQHGGAVLGTAIDKQKRPGAGVVNSGVYVFSSLSMRQWPARRPLSFELDVFPTLATKGEVAVQTVSAPFLDVGTPESLEAADAFIAHNRIAL